jgi:transcriptional regulator with XRE-family HTH domain
MKDIVTQRVNEFRKSNDLSVNAFAQSLNMNQATLNQQLKEDGHGVTLTTISLILQAYPDLSAEWLLRGDGSMKKGDNWKVTEFIPIQNNDLVDALKDHIATLKADNERMRKEIEEYRREKSGAAAGYGYMAAEGTPLTKTE